MRCRGSRTQITSDPGESDVREASPTVVGDENIRLHESKRRRLNTGKATVLLSGHHERGPCDGDTEDHAPRPQAATGLSQEVHEMEHVTCQFQRIGLRILPQEVDDRPILHPRRHHRILLTIHRNADQLQYFRVRQTLPNDDLAAKILQMVLLSRDEENVSKVKTVHLLYFLDIIWLVVPYDFDRNVYVLPIPPRPNIREPPRHNGRISQFLDLGSRNDIRIGENPTFPTHLHEAPETSRPHPQAQLIPGL